MFFVEAALEIAHKGKTWGHEGFASCRAQHNTAPSQFSSTTVQ